MNSKSLSNNALSVIEEYAHFKMGNAICSIPYVNNKIANNRTTLRAYIGKGDPKDIKEEIETLIVKNHLDKNLLTDEILKKLLVDNNIGIECSGFAYHILDYLTKERLNVSINKHLSFINCHGIIGKIRCSLRPAENCDVATFANNKNSRAISLNEIEPGDIITILNNTKVDQNRNHILIIHKIDYDNSIPKILYYSHAIAYPTDSVYGSGIRQGQIKIKPLDKTIKDSEWTEDTKTGENNPLFIRIQKSQTEVRRLNWL